MRTVSTLARESSKSRAKESTLRKLRRSAGIKLQNVALEIGISESHMSLLENGKRVPSLDLALRLAHFYETTVEGILAGKEKSK